MSKLSSLGKLASKLKGRGLPSGSSGGSIASKGLKFLGAKEILDNVSGGNKEEKQNISENLGTVGTAIPKPKAMDSGGTASPPAPKTATRINTNESNPTLKTLSKQLNVIANFLSQIGTSIKNQYDITKFNIVQSQKTEREKELEESNNVFDDNRLYNKISDAVAAGKRVSGETLSNTLFGGGSALLLAGLAGAIKELSDGSSMFLKSSKAISDNLLAVAAGVGAAYGVYKFSKGRISPNKGSSFDFAKKADAINPKTGKLRKGFEEVNVGKAGVRYRKKISSPKLGGLGSSALVGTALESIDYATGAKEFNRENITGSIGAVGGGILGAAAGSFFGPVGSIVGGTLGYSLGEMGGVALSRMIDSKKNSDFQPIEKEIPAGSVKYKSSTPGKEGKLLDFIANYESVSGRYDSVLGGGTNPSLTNMTVKEAYEYGQMIRKTTDIGKKFNSSAIGRYQFVGTTIKELVRRGVISWGDKFSPENQDKMALALLGNKNVKMYLSGQKSIESFAKDMAQVWQAFPLSQSGNAIGNKRALISWREVTRVLADIKSGKELTNLKRLTGRAGKPLSSRPSKASNILASTSTKEKLSIQGNVSKNDLNTKISMTKGSGNASPGFYFQQSTSGENISSLNKNIRMNEDSRNRIEKDEPSYIMPSIIPQKSKTSFGTSEVPNPSATNIMKEYNLYFNSSN